MKTLPVQFFITLVLAVATYLVVENGIDLDFSIDSALQMCPFFMLGILMKDKIGTKAWNMIVNPKMSLVWMIITFLLSYNNGRVSANICLYGNNILIYYVTAITGILMIASLSQIRIAVNNELIKTISAGTILIIGYHLILVSLLNCFINWGGGEKL